MERKLIFIIFFNNFIKSSLSLMIVVYLSQHFLIHISSFLIKEPAEFIKIFDCTFYVFKKHFFILVAFFCMVVNYRNVRIEQSFSNSVQTADKVKVLTIHKIAVVKKYIVFLKRACPHEHKATAEARRIHDFVVAAHFQSVSVIHILNQFRLRHEPAENQIKRSRK